MSYPIEVPEYIPMKNRLHGVLQGTEYYHNPEELDASKRKGRTWHTSPGNPCAEGFLSPDLRHLSLARLRDLI